MRKLLACVLLFALAISLFGCSKQDENLTIEEKISKLKLEDIEPFLESCDGIIWDDMHLIDKNWFQRFIASSTSRQDAIDICTREIEEMGGEEDTYVVTDCQVIYESDLFYGLEVHYEHHLGKACWEHKVKVISLKKEVADRNADGTAYKIYTDQEDVIKQAVLYAYFDKFLGKTVLSCDVERGEKDGSWRVFMTQ